ncbi:hypothetical protein B0H14DRAFT_2417074 [Mycena olivaceomarginata]|nr:hypothetical protein B0H14DRAFT_2417074 [Mycena olivaceomarginata]
MPASCLSPGIACILKSVTDFSWRRRIKELVRCSFIRPDSRFHLNMHGLHNVHLIRETLPRHLTELKPCFSNRRAKHDEFAAKLRETGPEKRAQAQAKSQATKLKNKQDQAEKAAGAQECSL